jgi:hypothetical protein
MGKKGRRGRSRKTQAHSKSAAPVALDESLATAASVPPTEAPPPVESTEPACPVSTAPASLEPSECTPPPVSIDAPLPGVESAASSSSVEKTASSQGDSAGEPRAPHLSVPPAPDLDTRFFAEPPSEAWLAHELELRDPHFLRKMTEAVARRRAHLARYVLGVLGVAVVLCLAALVKSAVPASDDAEARPAAQMAMPAAQPAPPALAPAAPTPPTASEDEVDGGG